MTLPSGHESRTRAEWMAIAEDIDPAKRRAVSDVLRALKVEPTNYMGWSVSEKIDFIMAAQGEEKATAAPEEKPKKTKAAPAAAPAETKKAANGVSAASAEVLELKATVERLEERIEDLQDTQAKLMGLCADAHFLVRILVQSDKKLKTNSEEPDLQEALYGNLVVRPGNGEG